MEQPTSPYKNISEYSFWQMTIRLSLLAGFFLCSGICLVITIKGVIDLMNAQG